MDMVCSNRRAGAVMITNYQDFEEMHKLDPKSKEGYWAEKAWDKATQIRFPFHGVSRSGILYGSTYNEYINKMVKELNDRIKELEAKND